MSKGAIEMELRPDILPGNVFTYSLFKDGNTYDFYIESVSHEYIFGTSSRTVLSLNRGLPSSVYQDEDLLTDILSGNAMRLDGEYVSGLPAFTTTGPLQTINLQSLDGLNHNFVTPSNPPPS